MGILFGRRVRRLHVLYWLLCTSLILLLIWLDPLESHTYPQDNFSALLSRISRKQHKGHVPGRLGLFLTQRAERATRRQADGLHHWYSDLIRPLFKTHQDQESEFRERIEVPDGFDMGKDTRQGTWRLNLLHQLENWKVHPTFRTWDDQNQKNTAALARLKRCLGKPMLAEPASDDPDKCSLRTTHIVLGYWWFWSLGFTKAGLSGEAIWISSMVDAMEEQGYTVLSVTEYSGMIDAHAQVPDLM